MSFAAPRPVQARWRPAAGQGLEQLDLSVEGDEIVARGVVIGERGGARYGVDYTVVCDLAWRVVAVDLGTTSGRALSLRSDGAGRWINHDGRPLPDFDGCLDVDLAGTPFTNTLPIRRLDWSGRVGRSIELAMLFVPFDSFAPIRDGQVYTALGDRLFRYGAADRSFEAELPVDEDGIVLDYPSLFIRLR